MKVIMAMPSICAWLLIHVQLTYAQLPNVTQIITAFEWIKVDYDWDSFPMTESEAQLSGFYYVDNNMIVDVEFYRQETFVTVPRWRPGVPSTLNKIVSIDNKPYLQPYPSFAMQQLNNCSALQYVQCIAVDAKRAKMWIIDTGNKYFFEDNASVYNETQYMIPDRTCPPKLVIWDMAHDQLDRAYTFPDAVAAHNFTFLSSLVLDTENERAFIADQFGAAFRGGLVVYDYKMENSFRFAHRSMQPDGPQSAARTVTVDGISSSSEAGIDAIALTPPDHQSGDRYLYYGPFSSYRTYRVRLADIMDRVYDNIEFIGNRSSQVDHMTFGSRGNLYFGALRENAVYGVTHQDVIENASDWIQTHQRLIAQNETTLQWPDAFGWPDTVNNREDRGWLYVTTLRLQKFFAKTMKFDGSDGVNIRIIKIKVNEDSYIYSDSDESTSSKHDREKLVVLIIAIVVSIILVSITIGCVWRNRSRFKGNDDGGLHQELIISN